MGLEEGVENEFFVRFLGDEKTALAKLSAIGVEVVHKYVTGIYYVKIPKDKYSEAIARISAMIEKNEITYWEPVRRTKTPEQ